MSVDKETSELLAQLAERCAYNLGSNATAQGYLRANGVTDENVWRRYRLGVGDDGLLDSLNDAQRAQLLALGLTSCRAHNPLASSAFALPTYDPRSMGSPVGFVGVSPAQNKHKFLTPPTGLACPLDIENCKRVILCDAPLLALRLAQAGAPGVCLAEDPAVLSPLADWLSGREIIAVSVKKEGMAKLVDGLGALSCKAEALSVPSQIARASESTLAVLGIDPEIGKQAKVETASVTPFLANEIVRYAQGRLQAGHGLDALIELEADDPEFVQVHGLGYLPPDYRESLSADAKRSLHGKHISGAIIIPSIDEAGNAVDAYAVFSSNVRSSPANLLDDPQGLLLGKAARTDTELIVCDSLRIAARLWRSGQRNVVMIRDVADATRNAERLYVSGVRSATLILTKPMEQVRNIESALKAAGIEVTIGKLPKVARDAEPAPVEQSIPPPPVESEEDPEPTYPAKPALKNYDEKNETAVFAAGDATYTVEVAIDSDTKLSVRLERGGNIALDRFDLAVEAQRKRYAVSAAVRTGIPFELIQDHLVAILDEAKRIQSERINPIRTPEAKIVISDEERREAIAFLKHPDLLDAIAADLESLGWVGEDRIKRFLYLIATSRKLEKPLSGTARAASGSGKSHSLEHISALIPPEDVLHVSRLTEGGLFYQSGDALRHKLLVLDESDILTTEVAVALRVLQSRGALSQAYTERDGATGQTITRFHEAKGPVAVLTSTTRELEEQTLSRCYQLSVDETPVQTQRVLEAQRLLRADPDFGGTNGRRARIVRRHHAIQRVLEAKPILIPFAGRIDFPASSLKYRREQERFLNLIEASALLHQHQRKQTDCFIVADEQDFRIALDLAGEHIARASDELGQNARDVLTLVVTAGLDAFDVNDLKALRADWTRHKFRDGIAELIALDLVSSLKRSRPRRYEVVDGAATALASAPVRLKATGEAAHLAESGERPSANSTPMTRTG